MDLWAARGLGSWVKGTLFLSNMAVGQNPGSSDSLPILTKQKGSYPKKGYLGLDSHVALWYPERAISQHIPILPKLGLHALLKSNWLTHYQA